MLKIDWHWKKNPFLCLGSQTDAQGFKLSYTFREDLILYNYSCIISIVMLFFTKWLTKCLLSIFYQINFAKPFNLMVTSSQCYLPFTRWLDLAIIFVCTAVRKKWYNFCFSNISIKRFLLRFLDYFLLLSVVKEKMLWF